MISLKELNPKGFKTTPEIDANLNRHLEAMNKFRAAYGKPMLVTSGLRSMDDHIRIYKELAQQRHKIFDLKSVPMGSLHLRGLACDVSDPDGSLYEYCKDNEKLLEQCCLYCEEKDDQARVHFQCEPPKSKKRWFYP